MNIDQGRVGRRLNLASKMIVGIGQILTQIKERRNFIYLNLWNRCISEVNKNRVSPWTEFAHIPFSQWNIGTMFLFQGTILPVDNLTQKLGLGSGHDSQVRSYEVT